MKIKITSEREARIWALALAIVARTKIKSRQAIGLVEHFSLCLMPEDVEDAKELAEVLADDWSA